MVKKNGDFIDPELKEDRFDFSGEPLTDEDIEKIKSNKKESQ